MQYSLHKGSIVKLRAKLMLQALVPAHSCKPRPFFSFSFFPFYTFPFLFVTGKHLMSARDPRRVSSPCSLLGSLASIWCYSHASPCLTHPLSLAHSPPLLHTCKTDVPTFPPHSSDVPNCADSAPASYGGG